MQLQSLGASCGRSKSFPAFSSFSGSSRGHLPIKQSVAVWSTGTQDRSSMQTANNMLSKYRETMRLELPALERVRDDFVDQMRAALATDGGSSLPMIPTLVDILPDGHEHGRFFSIDLGGTNLRVMYVKLPREHGVVDVKESLELPIPDNLRHCPAEELFDYLVETLVSFADKVGWKWDGRHRMIVGFCFSFPLQQTSLDSGKLIHWVKGFDNPGAEGEDVTRLLRDAFHRKKLKADVTALVNDTVGTLASAQYGDVQNNTETCISIIVGTGTNCCYLEQLSNLQKYSSSYLARTSDMIVNTEWADYTSEVLPWLEEDRWLDRDSLYPNTHHFEKMTSGRYLGGIARRILLNLAQHGGLFGGEVPPKLEQSQALRTPQMQRMHEDETEDRAVVAEVLQEAFDVPAEQATLETRLAVQEVCRLVGERGARLTAAGIAAILRHLGRDSIGAGSGEIPRNLVIVEGAVVRKYTSYRTALEAAAEELMGPGSIAIESAPRLSGTLGAALVAAASKSYMSGLSFYEP